MKTYIVFAIVALSSAVTLAQSARGDGAAGVVSAEQKATLNQQRRERRRAESGGILERDVKGNSTLVVNAQTAVPMSYIENTVASIRKLVQVKVEAVLGDPEKKILPTPEHPIVVSVVNDTASDVTILVAPEQCWARVNVCPLMKDNPAADVMASRIHKEVWRATAMVMGAANSMTQPCLMRQINTLHELDHTKNMLPSPQPINNMIDVADKFGIARIRQATYRKACEEGWAPAPTNDVQKAIWDKVHAMPTEPIKIKPEEKKTEK